MPASLNEALKEMQKDSLVMETLGSHIAEKIYRTQEERVERILHPRFFWEVENILTSIDRSENLVSYNSRKL